MHAKRVRTFDYGMKIKYPEARKLVKTMLRGATTRQMWERIASEAEKQVIELAKDRKTWAEIIRQTKQTMVESRAGGLTVSKLARFLLRTNRVTFYKDESSLIPILRRLIAKKKIRVPPEMKV